MASASLVTCERLGGNESIEVMAAKIDGYRAMGINAVPVIIVNERHVISNGAPELGFAKLERS